MISKKKLDDFTFKYNLNNELSKEWTEKIYQVTDKDTWLQILKMRSEIMHKIYQNNENMIQNILNPLKEIQFSDQEYELLFQWLKELFEQKESDPFLLQDFLEIVIPFFEQKNDMNHLIFLYYYKAQLYMDYAFAGEKNEFLISMDFFYKVIGFQKMYTSIRSPNNRKLIFSSYYNLLFIISKKNDFTLSSLDRLRDDFEQLRYSDEFQNLDGKNQVIHLLICDIEREYKNLSFQFQPAYSNQMEHEFSKQINQAGSLSDCDPALVSSYYMALAESRQITFDQCLWIMERYFYNKQQILTQLSSHDLLSVLNLLLEFPIHLMKCLKRSTLNRKVKEKKARQYRKSVMNFFKKSKLLMDSYILHQKLCDFAFHPLILGSITNRKEKEVFLFQFIISRHLGTCIHSIMVSRIASVILKEMLIASPNLLIGICGSKNSSDVSDKQELIKEFVKKCGLFHDIGKYGLIDIINTQNRNITAKEFSLIKLHPLKGYEYLSSDADLALYKEAALLHHKSFDGKSGYPANTPSSNGAVKIVVDLISVCDCIDAATDTLGRNYNTDKNFHTVLKELLSRSGTSYNPQILNLIKTSKTVKQQLHYLTTVKREEIYYEVYKRFA